MLVQNQNETILSLSKFKFSPDQPIPVEKGGDLTISQETNDGDFDDGETVLDLSELGDNLDEYDKDMLSD